MLPQHLAILLDDVIDEILVVLDFENILGDMCVVTGGGEQEGHVKVGCFDLSVFSIGHVDKLVGQFEKSGGVEFPFRPGGAAGFAVLLIHGFDVSVSAVCYNPNKSVRLPVRQPPTLLHWF